MVTFIVMLGTNGCVNSCVKFPEDGPVAPKHVEIRRYMNKIWNSDICWFFISYEEKCVCSVSLFRCNNFIGFLTFMGPCIVIIWYQIFIGIRIIKEMPGSVASGIPCTSHLRQTKNERKERQFSRNNTFLSCTEKSVPGCEPVVVIWTLQRRLLQQG
jgi:hypothetical protein